MGSPVLMYTPRARCSSRLMCRMAAASMTLNTSRCRPIAFPVNEKFVTMPSLANRSPCSFTQSIGWRPAHTLSCDDALMPLMAPPHIIIVPSTWVSAPAF